MESLINVLILQEILTTIGTLDFAIFENCKCAPDLGGSMIIASYFVNSSGSNGFVFKFLFFVTTLLLKPCFFAAILIASRLSLFISKA